MICNNDCNTCSKMHRVTQAHMCYDKKYNLDGIVYRKEQHQYNGERHLVKSYDSLPEWAKVYKIKHNAQY